MGIAFSEAKARHPSQLQEAGSDRVHQLTNPSNNRLINVFQNSPCWLAMKDSTKAYKTCPFRRNKPSNHLKAMLNDALRRNHLAHTKPTTHCGGGAAVLKP